MLIRSMDELTRMKINTGFVRGTNHLGSSSLSKSHDLTGVVYLKQWRKVALSHQHIQPLYPSVWRPQA